MRENGTQPYIHALAADCLAVILLFAVVVTVQYASGAYAGAFGGEADESAHYVTSLMVRDYLASGIFVNSGEFAEAYYLHYPRVAFGLWPPLFPISAAVWMLIFGTDRGSAFLLIACFLTVFSYVTYRLIKPAFGGWRAAASALFLISLPVTQSSAMTFMMDPAQAFVTALAAMAYARYLDSEQNRHAITFGVLASIAVLIKYNALLLALVPPLAVALTGRYYLLRRRSFWLPAIIVMAIAGPWYVVMYRFVVYAAEPGESWPALLPVAHQNAGILVSMAGPVIIGAAVAGGLLTAWVEKDHGGGRLDRSRQTGIYVVSLAVILSTFIFHSFLYPIADPRYFLTVIPFVILLGWKAVETVSRRAASSPMRTAFAAVIVALILVPYAIFSFRIQRKNTESYVEVERRIAKHQLRQGEVILAAAREWREGMLVAEVAMADKDRPTRTVVRATKFLAEQRLMGHEYRMLYNSPEELMRALDSIPVNTAMIETCASANCEAHLKLLEQTIKAMPYRWKLLDTIATPFDHVRIYRIVGNEGEPLRSLQIDMRPALGVVFQTRTADVGTRSRQEYLGGPGRIPVLSRSQ